MGKKKGIVLFFSCPFSYSKEKGYKSLKELDKDSGLFLILNRII